MSQDVLSPTQDWRSKIRNPKSQIRNRKTHNPSSLNPKSEIRNPKSKPCYAVNLGMIDYNHAWKLQSDLVAAKVNRSNNQDIILFLEHPAVFTLGRRGGRDHLLVSESFLKQSGIPIVHYVAPQFWAWRPGRVSQLTKRVDHVMALLPFEVSFFADHDIPCTYVGHPAIEAGAELGDGPAFRARHNLPPDAPVLCVVPGSRNGEVRRILPVFGEALLLLKQTYPDLHVVIPVVQSAAAEVTRLTRDWSLPVTFVTDMAERFDAFAACDAAMAKSGTVTLELALSNVPMVVGYRLNPITAFFVRRLARVKYASLVNLLADREVAQELLQEPCTPENLTAIIDELLRSSEAREAQREGFRAAIEALGERVPPPSERAAKVVLDAIRERGALEAP